MSVGPAALSTLEARCRSYAESRRPRSTQTGVASWSGRRRKEFGGRARAWSAGAPWIAVALGAYAPTLSDDLTHVAQYLDAIPLGGQIGQLLVVCPINTNEPEGS